MNRLGTVFRVSLWAQVKQQSLSLSVFNGSVANIPLELCWSNVSAAILFHLNKLVHFNTIHAFF